MKTILNKTTRPIKVTLSRGKVLHLGPSKTGQISDHAAQAPAIVRRVQIGELEILGQGAPAAAAGRGGDSAHELTHGHKPETMSHRRGNR